MTATPAPAPKQVLLVRKDLKMPAGKIAAQAGHAAQCSFTNAPDARIERTADGRLQLVVPVEEAEVAWIQGEYKKVSLGVSSEEELLGLLQAARDAGLRTFLVQDNGHTVFNGVKTLTAVAIGPAAPERINALTGHLRPL